MLLACGNEAEHKAEAGKLSHSIDELRTAPNQGKAQALAQLRALSCSFERTCSVQSTCVAAYELHVRGLEQIEEGKRLASSDAGTAISAVIAQAQDSLERAKALAQKCTDAQGELIRQFKLR